jgi:hypothetical protein
LNGTNGAWKVGREWNMTNIEDALKQQKKEINFEKIREIFDIRVKRLIKKYYLEVLTKLREGVRKKRPKIWKNNSWILH